LYNYALKISGNIEDAEDLVQDTYLKAYRYFDQYNSGTNCKAWMFMIMKNSFINNYRKEKREPGKVYYDGPSNFYLRSNLTGPASNSPEEFFLNQMLDDETATALNQLPEKMREVIVLCDIEEYSYEEIAEMVNIPVGTVRSRLHRARRTLQESLFDYAKDRGFLN
jgi:RNA polymerase sigma-70 factor, ECF subfamily